jgi:hypothetical protein
MGNTQEKTRLMKALEMRKKQQQAQVARQEKMAEAAVAKADADAEAEAEDAQKHMADDALEEAPPVDSGAAIDTADSKSTIDIAQAPPSETDASQHLDSSGLALSNQPPDTDDLNSTASVSSPVSAQTQGSSGAPSTRPSSLSDDEIAMQEAANKPEIVQDPSDSDDVDEEESVDSLPTVVPDSRTPVQSFIHTGSVTADHDTLAAVVSEPQNDAQARRRSKRESALYILSGGDSPLDDSSQKKRNRESVIMPTSKRQSWYETKEKRRAVLDPIQVSAENSEAEYLSDDSFMEELQSATVHEAKPMSVSKSPIHPYFSRKPSHETRAERSVSQAYAKVGRRSPDQLQRKTSGPWPPQVAADPVGVAKKITVSSGISQRIKALAEKSNRESSPPMTPPGNFDSSKSSLASRKSSFFATTPLETSPKSSRSVTRLGTPSFLNSSAPSSPEKKRTPTPKSIKATVYNVQKGNAQPESVQVTARIVRDERSTKPTLAMPNGSTPLDLHQSPLIIDHQKATRRQKSPTRGRAEAASPTATSHSREQSNGPSVRTSTDSGWKSFGRRMSESKSIHSHDGDDKRDDKKDKKESRTSKMFKRMSSSMNSMPWKTSSNNLSLPENDTRTTLLASLREPPPPVHVGDLNIQFPDTLLWRRRYVEIDSMGNLVLSPSKSNEKGIVKRFHLSEFRTPYPPDQDRQELPNSVVLDFIDGRTLQCACETYIAQAQVLQSKLNSFKY